MALEGEARRWTALRHSLPHNDLEDATLKATAWLFLEARDLVARTALPDSADAKVLFATVTAAFREHMDEAGWARGEGWHAFTMRIGYRRVLTCLRRTLEPADGRDADRPTP